MSTVLRYPLWSAPNALAGFALLAFFSTGIVGCGAIDRDSAAGSDRERDRARTVSALRFGEGQIIPPSRTLPLALQLAGRVVCDSPDNGAHSDQPLPDLPVTLPGYGTASVTDQNGNFVVGAVYYGGPVQVSVTYEGTITAGGATTAFKVMDDIQIARSDSATVAGSTGSGSPLGTLDLGVVRLSTVDCELWRTGAKIIGDFHAARGAAVPRGRVGVMRRTGVAGTTPYTVYDYVDLPNDFLVSTPAVAIREETLFHEFGHAVRDAADGDEPHWHWDDFLYRYARSHNGLGINEDAYSFHEGWADYWSIARHDPGARLTTGTWSAANLDWVENMVANRLLDLASCVGDQTMVTTLEANPGVIHSLFQFETRLCTANFCCGLERPAAGPCPPDYFNDGLTCRLDNIRAKPSYGRGVGSIPTGCGAGQVNDTGLCYPVCASNYRGVGPLCWQYCPAGYNDDGATCRRDLWIYWNNCTGGCPADFHNDGCTCRRDVDIFAKSVYGRGAGTIPYDCGPGRVNDTGLCYPPCASGYTGVGPICWGSCPAGFTDLGATCYRAPHIISRYP